MTLRLAGGALLLGAQAVHAGTPEDACQRGRYAAMAKYHACEQKQVGAYLAGGDYTKFVGSVAKCVVKLASTWGKLQARATGSGATCDNPREVDNGEGTVTDRLTGLQWEQKGNGIHSASNTYSWSVSGSAAGGTAFTTFLATLNGGACFAGQCDWRLPTRDELETLFGDVYLGYHGTVADRYWSGTTDATSPSDAWDVHLNLALENASDKTIARPVLAVRGGL